MTSCRTGRIVRGIGWPLAGLGLMVAAARRNPPRPAAPTAAATPVKLTLDWKPEPEFGGFYAAQLTGAFAAGGLDVTIKSAGPGAPTWQLVAAGKADFATTAADQVVVARSKGADVVAVYAVYQTSPQAVMVHAGRGFASLKDVFAAPGTLAAEDDAWLRFCRTKFGKGPVKVVGYTGGVAAFLAKPDYSQQCFVTSEPIEAKRLGGDPQTFLVADAGYNPYTTVVVCRGQTARDHPEQVKAIVAACRAGWRAYLDDPAATNAAMGKLNRDMDPATFAAAAEAQRKLIETADTRKSHLGAMTVDRWDELAKQLADLKVIDHPVPGRACFTAAAE